MDVQIISTWFLLIEKLEFFSYHLGWSSNFMLFFLLTTSSVSYYMRVQMIIKKRANWWCCFL